MSGLVVGLEEADSGPLPADGGRRRRLVRGLGMSPEEPCGIPRADARFVASEEVDFWRRAGKLGTPAVLANGRTGAADRRCFSTDDPPPPPPPFGEGCSPSTLFPDEEGKYPPLSLLPESFSAGREASCFNPAAHRSCWATRSSSVLWASGSLVVLAAEAKDVAASPCEAAAAARVAGDGEGAARDKVLEAWRAWW